MTDSDWGLAVVNWYEDNDPERIARDAVTLARQGQYVVSGPASKFDDLRPDQQVNILDSIIRRLRNERGLNHG